MARTPPGRSDWGMASRGSGSRALHDRADRKTPQLDRWPEPATNSDGTRMASEAACDLTTDNADGGRGILRFAATQPTCGISHVTSAGVGRSDAKSTNADDPTVVNDLVALAPVVTSFDPTPVPGGPAGTFTITATFTNTSSTFIGNPFFQVTELSHRNLLLNADAGPGGAGATLTPDVGPDRGDFNGDGKPDLAVANQFSNDVSILLNTCE